MFNRREFLISVAAGALASPFVLRRAWAQEFTFKFRRSLGFDSHAHDSVIEAWANRIRDDSEGRIGIDLAVTDDATAKADIIWTANDYASQPLSRVQVFELPGIFNGDVVAANLAIRQLFDTHLAADYTDTHIISLHVHAGHGLQMRDAPVRAPADLAGKRLRVPTRTSAWLAEALEVTPVGTALEDMPLALSTGVVDGCFLPWNIIPPFELQEFTQYQIEGPGRERFGTTTFQIAMDRQAWEALPPDLRKVFDDNSDNVFAREIGEAWRDAEERGIETALGAGNELIALTDDEMRAFREAMEPVDQRWIEDVTAKGIDGQALYDAAKAAITRHSGRKVDR